MTAADEQAQKPSEAKQEPKKRRGPRKESEIRAEAEAQLRDKIEAEVRAEYEQRQADEDAVREAQEAKPITGDDVTGDPSVDGAITIHFVEDGITLLGKVWYQGEELTLVPGTEQWEAAKLRDGRVFAELDEDAQIAMYGRRLFRPGQWKGAGFDMSDPNLTDEEREQLRRIENKRLERSGQPVR